MFSNCLRWGSQLKEVLLLHALLALVIDPIIKEALTSKFVKIISQSGDAPISVVINALADHGMTLIRATQNFQGGCMAYDLLQI